MGTPFKFSAVCATRLFILTYYVSNRTKIVPVLLNKFLKSSIMHGMVPNDADPRLLVNSLKAFIVPLSLRNLTVLDQFLFWTRCMVLLIQLYIVGHQFHNCFTIIINELYKYHNYIPIVDQIKIQIIQL